MLRFASIVLTGALALGGTAALAQDKKDKKEALAEAKEKAKEKAKEAKEKAKEKAKDKAEDAKDAKDDKKGDKGKSGEEHGKASEDHGKGKDAEHGKDGQDHGKPEGDKKVDAEGRGKAMTLDEENAKHAKRLEKIGALEAKAKDKPTLTAKVTELREKEMRRHEKALARINSGAKPDDKKDDGKKDDGKKDDAKKEGAK